MLSLGPFATKHLLIRHNPLGCSKSERRASEAAAKKQIKNIKWEEEREEEREDEEDMFR